LPEIRALHRAIDQVQQLSAWRMIEYFAFDRRMPPTLHAPSFLSHVFRDSSRYQTKNGQLLAAEECFDDAVAEIRRPANCVRLGRTS
jgi:hypothetical protein